MPRPVTLVTGGTRGIGRAIGLAYAGAGARVVLTHRWGSVEPDEIWEEADRLGVARPEVVESDVADDDDLERLLDRVGELPRVFVSNVCVAGRGDGRLHARTLAQSLSYSADPFQTHLDAMSARWGAPPRYVLATTSDGHEHFYPGYDYVAAAKGVLEALVAERARTDGDSVFIALRFRQVGTQSFEEMFDASAREWIARFREFDLRADDVARAAVALTSGAFDWASGAVVDLDRGATSLDNLMNVAPRLVGDEAAWSSPSPPCGRAPGILVVDAGGAHDVPGRLGGVSVTRVGLDSLDTVAPAEIPDVVVVATDWTRHGHRSPACRALVELMERNERFPRHGIGIDRGDGPGLALSRALARYYNGWHVLHDTKINHLECGEAPPWGAVEALVSGAFDALRGQPIKAQGVR